MSDLTIHYIGQETTTRSGRGSSSVANEAVGAMSLPNTGISSTMEVQVHQQYQNVQNKMVFENSRSHNQIITSKA